jgi:curved DNA-binding protein CbpA
MIVNPIIAAAAVAARAVGTIFPGVADGWKDVRMSRYDEYHPIMEQNWHEQSRELFDEYMTMMSSTTSPPPVKDAVILSKAEESTDNQNNQGRSTNYYRFQPPPLTDTNDPFELLGIQPGTSFDNIRLAYKQMTKLYHPDVVAGPNASSDERKEASWNFARINAAFDILKRRADEYDDQLLSDDPYRMNYNRNIEMSNYPRWYEVDDQGCACPPTSQNNDYFEPYSVDAHSKGKWWIAKDFDILNTDFGYTDNRAPPPPYVCSVGPPIPSKERQWEVERHFRREEIRNNNNGFGINPIQDHQWWDDGSAFDNTNTGHYHEYESRQSREFHTRMKQQGYPYKDRISDLSFQPDFDEMPEFIPQPLDFDDMPEFIPPSLCNDQRGRYAPKPKWWKGGEHIAGTFSP